MSEHVITIGGKQAVMVASVIRVIEHSAYQRLIRLENDLESNPVTLQPDVAEYWKTKTEELEHEVNELKALSTIFEGAESITVTHEVGKKK